MLLRYPKLSLRNQQKLRWTSTVAKPKTLKEMPGLTSLPLIGPLHHFLPIVGSIGPKANMFGLFESFRKKYGSIMKFDVYARGTMVVMFDPANFEQVYRAEEDKVLRPGFETLVYYRTKLRKDTYDGVYGLTTAQGDQWREFRTKVNPALLKLKLVKVYTPILQEIADEMVTRLKNKNDDSFIKENFYTELTKWSLESVAYVGLGDRIGILKDDLAEDHPARLLMKCASDVLDLSYKLEFMPNPWKLFPTPSYKKIIKTFDLQWDISATYIEEAKNRIRNRSCDVPDEEKSIIERLLAIDEKVAIMMANEMLFAGIDTVAFTVTGILYHLAINPRTQNKLRREIRSGEPTKRYLKACIKEALRIYPVIPANLRCTSKEHIVAGYRIPIGIHVIAPNEYLSKLEQYYPQPLEFIPERWLVEKSDPLYYGNAHPMVTRPFGFGVRTCIGRRIAELEMEIIVEKIIDELHVAWDGPPIKVVTKVMNGFEKPYNFRFSTAK